MSTERVKEASSAFVLVSIASILFAGTDWVQSFVAANLSAEVVKFLVGAFPFVALAVLGLGMYTTLASEKRERSIAVRSGQYRSVRPSE